MFKYFKLIFVVCSIVVGLPEAQAQLDFLLNESKEVLEIAAIADASADLIGELSPGSELQEGLEDVREANNRIASDAAEATYLSSDTRRLIDGPRWSQNRLDNNIRQTTNYIRRLKRLWLRFAALGTDGVVAVNGLETNASLNEIQKNQQVMILQNSQMMNRQLAKEVADEKTWSQFIAKQRSYRSVPQGH